MVDALRETHRVLKPDGILLDLRPQASNAPLEVVTGGDAQFVYRLDGSPGVPDDIASDEAVQHLVTEGALAAMEEQYFLFHDYWDSVDELLAYAAENWNRYVIPNVEDLREARQVMIEAGPGARIRTTKRIRLRVYRVV